MKIVFTLILFVASLVCPIFSYGEVIDRIIAIVNDDIITLKEVERHVQIEKKGQFVSVNEYLRKIQLKDKIDTFINNLLIKQQAKKLKIEVSDKDIEMLVENIKRQNLITEDQLKEQLKKEKISYRDFIEGLRTNLFRSKVLARVISPDIMVTDKQMVDYYNTHKEQFRDEEYRLQHILISNQTEEPQKKALNAYTLLREGSAFETVAKSHSDDPSNAQGGDIGYVKKEELIPELRAAISNITPGTYTQIVRTPYGYHILKLTDVKKGDAMPFETAKDAIHQRIVQEESEKRYQDFISKLRKSSYIEVKI